jgi:hypothetical protein
MVMKSIIILDITDYTALFLPDKRRSLGRYISLADYDHGGFFLLLYGIISKKTGVSILPLIWKLPVNPNTFTDLDNHPLLAVHKSLFDMLADSPSIWMQSRHMKH